MIEDRQTEHRESLGEYLRRCRSEKNVSVDDVQKETRIPMKALLAIEADDYTLLPADVFARGFYVLYAKYLQLDYHDVLTRFDRERTANPVQRYFTAPTRKERRVNTMAARPSMAPGSTLGFSLVVLIAAIALLSWYFSWNPATFISSKLQNIEESATTEIQGENAVSERNATTEQSERDLAATNYFFSVDFLEDTTITIAIDDGFPEKGVYTKGSTRSWYADEKISLILPETAKVNLFFNGSRLEPPEPKDGIITLSLP